jgi:hypothetical protein
LPLSALFAGHDGFGDPKLIPPGIRVAVIDFYGSAIISFKIECTDDDKCKKKKWTIAPDIDVGKNFGVPVRVQVSHPIITAIMILKAADDARKFLEHWSEIQLAYYLASDPTAWCLGNSLIGGSGGE